MLQIINVSNDLPGGLETFTHDLNTLFTDDGTLHIVWLEGDSGQEDLYYWNTKDKSRITLSDSSFANGKPKSTQIKELATNHVQAIWYEDDYLHTWDSNNATTTQLIALPTNHRFFELWFGPGNSAKAVWAEPEVINSNNDDLIVWESNGTETNLSTLAGTNGDINHVSYAPPVQLFINEANQDFIFWVEETGTAESEDRFVAYPEINLPEKAYLPMIQK